MFKSITVSRFESSLFVGRGPVTIYAKQKIIEDDIPSFTKNPKVRFNFMGTIIIGYAKYKYGKEGFRFLTNATNIHQSRP